MGEWFPFDKRQLKRHNRRKYRCVPPSWELCQKAIDKSGLISQAAFELVWGLPDRTLTNYKNKLKGLPAHYWHIIYDFDQIRKNALRQLNNQRTAPTTKHILKPLESNKQKIDELRQRISQ
jgi:hypothetical protein